jgi:hypothetical protein
MGNPIPHQPSADHANRFYGHAIPTRKKKASTSFLKKRSKKLSVLRALATQVPPPTGPDVFLVLFFLKKELLA